MAKKFMRTNIKIDNLIYPYFVIDGKRKREKIDLFPGIFRFSVDELIKDIESISKLGIGKILLFGVSDKKDPHGSFGYSEANPLISAIKNIRKRFPEMTVISDICLCAYTSHGHCGILKSGDMRFCGNGRVSFIDRDKTLKALSRMAILHADAGAGWVAPSAMVDGQVGAIRRVLDRDGFRKAKIMGYSAKFASNFYGPFRNAANSSPRFGNRSAYQLDPFNERRAMKEISDDIKEGASMVMVKPALLYLDIISKVRREFDIPIAAYNVSGEYSMVKYASASGVLDEKASVLEIIGSIRRAGAGNIITYHAKDIARWLKR